MLALVNQIFEQLFPFVTYLRFRARKMRELNSYILNQPFSKGPVLDAIRIFSQADPSDLKEALLAEQVRGAVLDEKTFRHAASIATALTVASATTTAIAQLLTGPGWKLAVVACTIPATAYVMIGGLLGFGAARALPMFGVGIRFVIEQSVENTAMKPLALAKSLACQEAINLIRVARNEAAFMSMRNGFVFVVLAVSLVLLGVVSAKKSESIDLKIWPATFLSL